jgi:DNA-binding MarR family transcriptional regulator
MGASTKPEIIDRDALHALLFLRADGKGHITVRQGQLAVELCTNSATVCRTLGRMVDDGRLTTDKNSTAGRAQSYVVTDPLEWRQAQRS